MARSTLHSLHLRHVLNLYPYVIVLHLSVFRQYYGLGDAFPSSQLLTRSVGGKKRNIYLTSRLVKELLQRNELYVKVS